MPSHVVISSIPSPKLSSVKTLLGLNKSTLGIRAPGDPFTLALLLKLGHSGTLIPCGGGQASCVWLVILSGAA